MATAPTTYSMSTTTDKEQLIVKRGLTKTELHSRLMTWLKDDSQIAMLVTTDEQHG